MAKIKEVRTIRTRNNGHWLIVKITTDDGLVGGHRDSRLYGKIDQAGETAGFSRVQLGELSFEGGCTRRGSLGRDGGSCRCW